MHHFNSSSPVLPHNTSAAHHFKHVLLFAASYSHKGCYKDSPTSRALPKLLGVYNGQQVLKCAAKTFSLHYQCFGVQNGGECWSGHNAHNTYYKYNKCSKCQHGGNGGPFANDVYCFSDGNAISSTKNPNICIVMKYSGLL